MLSKLCTPRQWKLCGKDECKICTPRAVFYHPRAHLFHDKTLNLKTIFKCSATKYYFDCLKCGHVFESTVGNMTCKKSSNMCGYCDGSLLCEDLTCIFCWNKSFASHPRSQFLHDKNLDPRFICKGCKTKYWFDCITCGHCFESTLNSVTKLKKPTWCGFCKGPLVCEDLSCKMCFDKSFASHPRCQFIHDKNINPRFLCKSCHTKIFFDCPTCNHIFEASINSVTNKSKPTWCPFCKGHKVCENRSCNMCFEKSLASHPRSQFLHDRSIDPRFISKFSHDKYFFDCNCCGFVFESILKNVTKKNNPTWCPICPNKTETKLYEHLKITYPTIKSQYRTSWCKNPKTNYSLPFDFCIENLKIIIELDGIQHFEQVSSWLSPKDNQKRDHYKMKLALKNNYTVIRLYQKDVWDDRKTYWKDKLAEILYLHEVPEEIYICENDEYDVYKNYVIQDLIPIVNKPQTINKTPTINKIPAINKLPTINKIPTINKPPTINKLPTINKTPTINKLPIKIQTIKSQ